MTKYKVNLENVNVLTVIKKHSKRGNSYLVLVSEYDDQIVNFYFPDFDSDLDFETLKGIHTLTVEITISKISSVKVLNVR